MRRFDVLCVRLNPRLTKEQKQLLTQKQATLSERERSAELSLNLASDVHDLYQAN